MNRPRRANANMLLNTSQAVALLSEILSEDDSFEEDDSLHDPDYSDEDSPRNVDDDNSVEYLSVLVEKNDNVEVDLNEDAEQFTTQITEDAQK